MVRRYLCSRLLCQSVIALENLSSLLVKNVCNVNREDVYHHIKEMPVFCESLAASFLHLGCLCISSPKPIDLHTNAYNDRWYCFYHPNVGGINTIYYKQKQTMALKISSYQIIIHSLSVQIFVERNYLSAESQIEISTYIWMHISRDVAQIHKDCEIIVTQIHQDCGINVAQCIEI